MHKSNIGVCTLLTEQDAEVLLGATVQEAKSMQVSNADIYSPASQLDRQREIICRLPEHVRCVLPPEGDSEIFLTLPQLEDAVELLLKYEIALLGQAAK